MLSLLWKAVKVIIGGYLLMLLLIVMAVVMLNVTLSIP